MTVGPLFTISAINVARAAVRDAERTISIDAPVDIHVGGHGPDGSARLYVEVSSRGHKVQRINIDDAAVSACLADLDHDTSHRMVSDLVERLTREIKAAVEQQLIREHSSPTSGGVIDDDVGTER